MINYYDDIDYLEFQSQLDFISESIEILAINEGIGSRISNIFKGIGNFITKVKDWISGVIGKVFNKEQAKCTIIEKQADNIISQSKGGEIPIEEEIKPKVAEKINNIAEQIKSNGSGSDTQKQTEKPKQVDNKYTDTQKQTEKPKQVDNKTDNVSKTVKDVSNKYTDTPKQTEKPIRTNKTKYSVNIIFRNIKRFEECLSIKDTVGNMILKSIDFININRTDILKGGEMEKFNKFEKDNDISDILKKIDKIENPTSYDDIWEGVHFNDVNDIKIVSIIKNRIKILSKLNRDMKRGLIVLDKYFNKFKDTAIKLEKDMDALYDNYNRKDAAKIYSVVDIFTDIRFKTNGYIKTTRKFIKYIKSETDNLWKTISIIKSGIAPIEKEKEREMHYWNYSISGVKPEDYVGAHS